MGTFWLLATEAAEAHEGGFGLNFDLLETNLINLVIIIGVLFYFGRGFLGKTLSDRQAKIEAAIKDAEKRQKDAAAALAEQQQKLAQAQAEAERIRKQAQDNAQRAKEEILAQSVKEVERLRETATQEMNVERERAIAELRQRVATMALARAEAQLKEQLDEDRQQRLVDRSIAMLGG
ncbi:F0F1 ATP synthase subunit B [Desertifilum sp. FACHB-1129]|uniref:ATP synthase subunit b n=3 Tax=Cyanophyceae TaxID=3028117 RepID=A0A1E5QIP2_9CYAN|nr:MULTISPECIES: F0F1 ATP synthase subunit B [Cyanophyceae]MCD8488886.1 F0F1 ATP synthase subunit B [Desertifilum sp.]MDA0210522.1 F0F1 ATP synthase subunit B [Cyanobacteria bacterium FC1]MDI9636140.1 F0F1 ATP synthase subunit B [Geitlerinema splendidum]MDK3160150.1 F0F1 ATP synthase subunit B [Kamptonema cortianum]MBD2311522.1 F0F1 ATP synthase subunit B [Desertifilum sp. FACHB-1129]